jgi:hypothetical protein
VEIIFILYFVYSLVFSYLGTTYILFGVYLHPILSLVCGVCIYLVYIIIYHVALRTYPSNSKVSQGKT